MDDLAINIEAPPGDIGKVPPPILADNYQVPSDVAVTRKYTIQSMHN